MKKLIYLTFLAIGMTGCSVESLDSTDNLVTADMKAKFEKNAILSVSTEPLSEYTFFSGNSINEKARLTVSNTCDDLTLTFTPLNEDVIEVKFDIFKTLPAVNVNQGNGKETLPNGTIRLDENDLDANSSYTISFVDLGVSSSEEVYVFARMGNEDAGSQVLGDWEYFTYIITDLTCEDVKCESGYMIGDLDFDEIATSKNWGWAHQFSFDGTGSETREIHHKNGTLEGTVTVTYNNGLITIEEGEGVSISHLYISNDKPETNSPGQFDKEQNFEDEDGEFWVIIKAEVCN